MCSAQATPELNRSTPSWPQTASAAGRGDTHGSGHATPFASPTKLAPHHSIFMANLQRSPTAKGSALFSETPGSSSTKVIESLHEQIDVLSRTNLQLSTQSQGLLSKLEDTQDREGRLVKSLSGLKNENETLKSLLTRESDHLKDLESSLTDLNEQCNALNRHNKEMRAKISSNSHGGSSLDEELLMVQAQYSSLLEAQEMARSHYDAEIARLKEELQELTAQHAQTADRFEGDSQRLTDAIAELSLGNREFQEMYRAQSDAVDGAFQRALEYGPGTQLDNPAEQYNSLKQELVDIGAEMDIATVERDIADMQTVKLQRVRNVSNSGSNAAKRTSFYGSMSPVADAHSDSARNTSAGLGLGLGLGLPGVKRSLSKRRVGTPTMSEAPVAAAESPSAASPALRRARGSAAFQ
ncbi:She3 protein [Maudiozyma humilis]|uniref:SWI5-dependent HO expression protein 3 n=1 Tax=Maudiozyma humilis TaxID=51915 RepID=A0AAV5RS94_MAUHU|nr:She3 protein [Kazachstania humilis]